MGKRREEKCMRTFMLSFGIAVAMAIIVLLMPETGMKVLAVDWSGDVTTSGTINEAVNITSNTTLTLDGELNINGGITIYENCSLSITGSGTIIVSTVGSDNTYVIHMKPGSKLEIDGGEVKTIGNNDGIGQYTNPDNTDNNTTLIVNSGKLVVQGSDSANHTGIIVGSVEVNGGNLEAKTWKDGIEAYSMEVNGGNVEVESCSVYGIHASNLKIKGGKIDSNVSGYAISSSTMTVEDGNIIAQGGLEAFSPTVLFSAPTDMLIEAGDSAETAAKVDAYNGQKYLRITKKSKLDLTDDQKPTGRNLKYNGQSQSLLNAPKDALPDGYTMKYILGDANAPSQGTWSTQIPEETEPGTYYVWFKAEGSGQWLDSDAEYIEVKIIAQKNADVTFVVKNGSWNSGDSDNIVVTLTGDEGDTLKLSADDIPSVGNKPAEGCKEGIWDVTPKAGTVITENTTYTYTYGRKEDLSSEVTFKVVNGSWDDGKSENKKITLKGKEGDTLKLSADDIPAVGKKPADGYQEGSWDKTPSAGDVITTDTTYTYTYTAKGEIAKNVTFKVIGGCWDDGTTADKIVRLTGKEGDTLKLADTDIPSVGQKPSDGYTAGSWDKTPNAGDVITEDATFTYSYASKGTISRKVTFKVKHGTWDDGTSEKITVKLTGKVGDTLTLSSSDIPAVGNSPADGYTEGSWDVIPKAGDEITEDTVFTYSYDKEDEPEPEISISVTNLSLKPGKEKVLSVTTVPEGLSVKWKSSDKNVATVDEDGKVTAKKPGTTVITATISVNGEKYSAECEVTVTEEEKKEEKKDTHSHNFVWETIEPTPDTDGEYRYVCSICGGVQVSVPITAYYAFNKEVTEEIRNAKQDETVKIETSRWISFHKMVLDALSERPDITLEVSFLDEEYKGNRCMFTIPKGTDTTSLVDENGFSGFLYLLGKFGNQ